MIPLAHALANHLWQSTLVAAFAGLLTLALRTNHARVRHALWLVASVKFLIPFSLLIAIGSHSGWQTARPAPDQVSVVMQDIALGQEPGASGPTPDASGPSLFPALQEQLGLKLEAQKGPVEFMVVDHVESPVGELA